MSDLGWVCMWFAAGLLGFTCGYLCADDTVPPDLRAEIDRRDALKRLDAAEKAALKAQEGK